MSSALQNEAEKKRIGELLLEGDEPEEDQSQQDQTLQPDQSDQSQSDQSDQSQSGQSDQSTQEPTQPEPEQPQQGVTEAVKPAATSLAQFNDLGLDAFIPPKKEEQQRTSDQPQTEEPTRTATVDPADPAFSLNPNKTPYPDRILDANGNEPLAFITHHTSGRGTVQGVIDTLHQRGLGVEYIMDRDGNIYDAGFGAGASNILPGWGPKGEGLSNKNIVGMEIIAKNDADVTQAQKESFARFIQARYPNTPVLGHGEVNPGHKEEDEGRSTSQAALALRTKLKGPQALPQQVAKTPTTLAEFNDMGLDYYTTPQQPQLNEDGTITGVTTSGAVKRAEPAGKQATGFMEDEDPKTFVTGGAHVFSTPDDLKKWEDAKALGASDDSANAVGDSGWGASKLGKLDNTQTIGAAVPLEALRAVVGDKAGDMRKARLLIIGPNGERYQVPITDFGPRDTSKTAADFTPGLANLFKTTDGQFSFKIIPNAGPDVTKDPQAFADEQAALKQGIDLSTVQGKHAKFPTTTVSALTKEQQEANAQAVQEDLNKQKNALDSLPESKSNSIPGLIKRLEAGPVEGVTAGTQQEYLDSLKKTATAYAQEYYHIDNPDEAYKKIMSDATVGTFLGEIGTKAWAYMAKAGNQLGASGGIVDENRINDFFNMANPYASPEKRAQGYRYLLSLDPETRRSVVAEMYSQINPQITAGMDLGELQASFDRQGDGNYQAARQAMIARDRAAAERDLQTDPRLKGTAAEFWTQNLAQLPKNIFEGLTGAFGQSMMVSEMYFDALDQAKKDHPDWPEDAQKAQASKSTLYQLGGAELLNRTAGGALLKMTGGISNPIERIIKGTLLHVGVGAGGGSFQQMGKNIAEGKALMTDLPEAAAAGAVQSLPTGLIGSLHYEPKTEERGVPRGTGQEPKTEKVEPEKTEPQKTEPSETQTEPEKTEPEREEEHVTEKAPEPEKEELGATEEELNRRTEDLAKRYETEEHLKPTEPTKEEPVTATRQEQTQPLGEQGAEPARETEQPVAEEKKGPTDLAKGESPVDGSPPERQLAEIRDAKLTPEERQRFQPLVDKIQDLKQQGVDRGHPQFIQAVKDLTGSIADRFRHILDANGIRIKEGTESSAMAADMDEHGNFSILHNPEGVARVVNKALDNGLDPVHLLHAAMQEELIHVAHEMALRDKWQSEGGREGTKKSAWQYITDHHVKVWQDIARHRDEAQARGDKRTVKELNNAIENSWHLYQRKHGEEPKFSIDHALADPNNYHSQKVLHLSAFELARQLQQLKGKAGETTEHFDTGITGKLREFYQNVKSGLLSMLRRMGPNQSLGKLEIAKLLRAIDAKIKQLEKGGARLAKTEPRETAPGSHLAPEFGLRDLGEAIKEREARWGLIYKSGESALMSYGETRALSRALRHEQGLRQLYGARAKLNALEDAFNAVKDKKAFRQEFEAYTKAEQLKQPLPTVSQETMRVIQAGKDTLHEFGRISKELGVHVRDSDGNIRPMRMIGREYYPRMLSRKIQEIFNERDGAKSKEFDQLVNDQIARGVVKSRQEFIDKFIGTTNFDSVTNDHFSNLEKARQLKLPLDFYDFSPEALLRYAGRANDRLAQIGAYGQKLSNKGKDLFDHTLEQVQNSGDLSGKARRALAIRVAQERRAAYRENYQSNLDHASSLLRSFSSGAMLGNPITSTYNLVSGAAQNFVFGGASSFAKAMADMPKLKMLLQEARDRNITRSNLNDILRDYDTSTNQGWATKGVQGFTTKMLNWGGQNLTEGINRAFAMQQAKYMLQEFSKDWGIRDNFKTRSMADLIRRRGIKDLNGLVAEKGSGPLTDEFIRQWVMDTHGNYSPAQSAAHIFDSKAGKMLLQFQKWGANTQRMYTREFLAPIKDAAKERRYGDMTRHILRNVGYIATATGAGVTQQILKDWMTGKDPDKATIQEMMTRFGHGDGLTALTQSLARAGDAIILSGFMGTMGNYADLMQKLTGNVSPGRSKDPFHPPAWSMVQPWVDFVNGWNGESGFTKSPSSKIMDNLMSSVFSQWRTGKQIGLHIADVAGLKSVPYAEEYAANNDLAFLRSRVRQFENENPVYRAKREATGTRSILSSGRGPFDPYRDRIQAALLTGNDNELSNGIRDWLKNFPEDQWRAQLKKVRSSIISSAPIKPGGAGTEEAVGDFLEWGQKNLPPEEYNRVLALEQMYLKTATRNDVLPYSPHLNKVMNLATR